MFPNLSNGIFFQYLDYTNIWIDNGDMNIDVIIILGFQ